ncbi:tetratricopeptide repeat protein [Fructilactobacillus florum]|uniref:Uncharacterized protein n=1 Tax=Fructilactobacillus florum DSM 22689 = JCM 16035 TaxID=1423745 RepID=A0A0R2CJJ8_9LACO|nr:tetratricopeptide repeat protein [Fructilactobacillus florum]KRM91450.1 hypothetical protein FC87_GL000961 [Fructilactobacillus florum DSM 22689 = JCM 16035]
MSFSEQVLTALHNQELQTYQQALGQALEHDDDELLNSLAEELYALGFNDDAIKIYQQLLQKYPSEDELRTNLADLMIAQDEEDQALNYLNEIKPSSDYYVNALLVAADLYQTQGFPEVSEQKLLQAKALAPHEPVITFALAELYYATQQPEKAQPLYLQLLKSGHLEISNVNLVERLGVTYAQLGHFEQALGYLEQIEAGQQTPTVKFELGVTYLQLGQLKAAIEQLQQLQTTDPQFASLYLPLGEALAADQQPTAALHTLQEGLRVDEYNDDLYLKLAELAEQLQQPELAKQTLRQGYQINPENQALINQLSAFELKQGNYRQVLELVDSDQGKVDVTPQLAWDAATAATKLELWEQAESFYQQAATGLLNNPDFLKQATLFYREMGKQTQAIKFLNRYLAIVPDDPEMEELLIDLNETL